jgi:hypothetical protein
MAAAAAERPQYASQLKPTESQLAKEISLTLSSKAGNVKLSGS